MRPKDKKLKKIIVDTINDAVGKQAEGFSAEEGLEERRHKGRLRTAQIWRRREKPQIVIIQALDKLRKNELYQQHLQKIQGKKQTPKTQKRRRRRRGPKVLTCFSEEN